MAELIRDNTRDPRRDFKAANEFVFGLGVLWISGRNKSASGNREGSCRVPTVGALSTGTLRHR